jgi:hypothetical protein
MTLALRCACGSFEGRVDAPERAGRAICYCRDCRAYARWLGHPERTLDAAGGTDVVATAPRLVRFERGSEHLRCMSLGPRGLYRWYAGCCRTPIGNTPRDPKLSYVGLVREVVAAAPEALDAAVGPPVTRISADSALARVAPTPMHTLRAVAKIARGVGGARLSGRWRENPFFRLGSAEPVVAPTVLSLAEREALRDPA